MPGLSVLTLVPWDSNFLVPKGTLVIALLALVLVVVVVVGLVAWAIVGVVLARKNLSSRKGPESVQQDS